MKVSELKQILDSLPEDLEVVVWRDHDYGTIAETSQAYCLKEEWRLDSSDEEEVDLDKYFKALVLHPVY